MCAFPWQQVATAEPDDDHGRDHSHDHGHDHSHDHGHGHSHDHGPIKVFALRALGALPAPAGSKRVATVDPPAEGRMAPELLLAALLDAGAPLNGVVRQQRPRSQLGAPIIGGG